MGKKSNMIDMVLERERCVCFLYFKIFLNERRERGIQISDRRAKHFGPDVLEYSRLESRLSILRKCTVIYMHEPLNSLLE